MIITDLISSEGGIKDFSSKYGIPYRTVQDWYSLKRVPSPWLISMFIRLSSMPVQKLSNPSEVDEKFHQLISLANAHRRFTRTLEAGGLRKCDSKNQKFLRSLTRDEIIKEVEKLF
jgi:hypothetical protein